MPKSPETPYSRLRKLKELLGWRAPLRQYRHRPPRDADNELPSVITWYECGESTGGRQDCFLQINQCPQGQTDHYAAAVYAIRFRICTGWLTFHLPVGGAGLRGVAEQLSPWLQNKWFEDLIGRRTLRASHPECVGYTWTRLRREGPPQHHDGEKPRTIGYIPIIAPGISATGAAERQDVSSRGWSEAEPAE